MNAGADVDSLEFLERLRAGDAGAFEALVTTYQHRVFAVALRMLGNSAEAEEVAQEVFLRVSRAVAGFRGDARLSTWLYGITSRVCLSRLASGHFRVALQEDEALTHLVSGAPDAAETAARAELRQAVRRAIADLPEERRIVVVLRDLEGLSYDEISRALDVPVGTVRSRLHRARLDLRDKLERFLP